VDEPRVRPSGRALQLVALVAPLLLAGPLPAGAPEPPTPTPLSALVEQPEAWYQTPAGRRAVAILRSWQNANGGWWKDYDVSVARSQAVESPIDTAPAADNALVWHRTSTFDDGATVSEMRVLARAFRLLRHESDRSAFQRGLAFVLAAQYPNGGWPQRFPLEDNYGRHVTFNDGAMTGVMALLKDVADGLPDFAFVSEGDRARCQSAFERGVDCILACQVRANGRLTVWAQQHDAQTLAPAAARSYELPALSAAESAEILTLLMRRARPEDPRLPPALEAALAWYESARITGKRVLRVPDARPSRAWDKILVDDPTAPALWARFYDLETNEPFYCDRDGVKRKSLAEIGYERRVGYRWHGTWGSEVVAEYASWLKHRSAPRAAAGATPPWRSSDRRET
jgi:PelA/Pel-15E family pectate lyase